MWGKKLKKRKAVDRWHTKAMLVDPRKVKITMVWASDLDESAAIENSTATSHTLEVVEPRAMEAPNAEEGGEGFSSVDSKLVAASSGVAVAHEARASEENLETGGPEFGSFDSPICSSDSGNLGFVLSGVGDAELSPETVPLKNAETHCDGVSEASNRVVSGEVTSQESCGSPPADANPQGENECDLISEAKEPPMVQFLRALEKTRSRWDGDAQFAKIVHKMQKGQTLSKKEFETVYLHIHTYCQYH